MLVEDYKKKVILISNVLADGVCVQTERLKIPLQR